MDNGGVGGGMGLDVGGLLHFFQGGGVSYRRLQVVLQPGFTLVISMNVACFSD